MDQEVYKLVYIFHNNLLDQGVRCLSKTTNSRKFPPCHFLIKAVQEHVVLNMLLWKKRKILKNNVNIM